MIALLALTSLQAPDPALDALFADPPAPPSCSVVLTVDVRETGDGGTERQVYAYDRTSGAWTYRSRDGGAPTEDEASEAADEAAARTLPAGYYAEALGRGGLAWAPVPGEPGLYRAGDLPDGEIEMNGRDLSDRLALDYRVERTPGGVRLVTGTAALKAPFRVPFVAAIDALSIRRDYAPAGPGTGVPGAMLPTAEHIVFRGDVMGEAKDSVITTAFSGWDCVPGG